MTDVCNYADDTTFHACDLDLESIITKLEDDATLAIEWFESNYMMLNQDKCYFLFSGYKFETFVNVGETIIVIIFIINFFYIGNHINIFYKIFMLQ